MKSCYLTALIAMSAWARMSRCSGATCSTPAFTTAPASVELPHVEWRFKTQGKVISSPAVANGTVYAGSTDHNLYAVDQRTGALKWKFGTGSRLTSSPAVAGGLVFFGSFDGNFYAVEEAGGGLRWKFETEGERRWAERNLHGMQPGGEIVSDAWDFYLSSPAVFEGTVYFGSGDGFVYALDAASGKLRWKFRTGSVVHASPAIEGGTVFIGSWDSGLYALEAASGKLKWKLQTGTDPQIGNQQGFQSSPAVVNGIVYSGCRDAKLYAVDARTGEKKWEYFNNGSWVITSPAVLDGRVYLGTSDTGLFITLDAATGAKISSVDAHFPVFASPAIAGGAVYVATFEGKLRALRPQDATKCCGPSRPSPRNRTPRPLRTRKAGLISRECFNRTLSTRWRPAWSGCLLWAPSSRRRSIDGNALYFGSTDGYLYALN